LLRPPDDESQPKPENDIDRAETHRPGQTGPCDASASDDNGDAVGGKGVRGP
jgi:hypothetical protein